MLASKLKQVEMDTEQRFAALLPSTRLLKKGNLPLEDSFFSELGM